MEPYRVLIIEDSPDQQVLLTQILGRKYETACVATAALARETLARERFDLILLDVELPDQSGFALCAEIRQDENLRSIPVVFLSGHVEPADKVHGFSVGGDDYVCKPFEHKEFNARIEFQLRKSREVSERTE
ncbi:MAG: response regulator, partial [Bdellovibrionota bacterium]